MTICAISHALERPNRGPLCLVIGFIGLAVRDEHDDRIDERMLMAHQQVTAVRVLDETGTLNVRAV